MKNKTSDNKILRYLFIICFALVPVIALVIMSIVSGQSLFNVFMPAGKANDEMFYYKQIDAIIGFLMPQGYFSYNEAAPLVGSYGAWIPLIYVPYALIGKIIGWNFGTILFINVLMMCIGFLVFALMTDCSVKTKICAAICYCAMLFYTKSVYCGMVEALFYMNIILFISILFSGMKYSKKYDRLLLIAVLSTIMRPYYLLMFAVLFIIDVKDRKWFRMAVTILLACVSAVLYFGISHYFCAPYFTSGIIDATYIEVLHNDGIIRALACFLADLIKSLSQVREAIIGFVDGSSGYGHVGEKYFIITLQLIAYAAGAVISAIKKNKGRVWTYIGCIIGNLAMLVAVIVLYDVFIGYRHLMSVILANLLILLYLYDKSIIKYIIVGVVLIVSVLSFRVTDCGFSNYTESNELRSEIDARSDAFENLMQLKTGVSWDNTVVYVFPETDFHVFYSLPRGFGISICKHDYLDENHIKSGYILSSPEATTEYAGFEQIYSDDKCVLYKRK